MSEQNQSRRYGLIQYGMMMALSGVHAASMMTQTESRHKLTRGGGRKHLPGGLRGMSQRQRRKRVRQGVCKPKFQ